VGVLPNNVLRYIEADHLGTPRQVVDRTRNVAVWRWDLINDPFGESAPNTNPDADGTHFVFNMRFPGQIHDAESGLNYNYFRDYDSGVGRYVESDPIGLRGDIATFAYASSKPLRYIDPDGKEPIVACDGGYGVLVCDGNGRFKTRNCNNGCTRDCTQAHENQHLSDYVARAPNRCNGKKDGESPSAEGDLESLFFYQLECRAERVGKKCAERMMSEQCLSDSCKADAQKYIKKANYYLEKYKCDGYGW
jgi:RHS repeat-associated protein